MEIEASTRSLGNEIFRRNGVPEPAPSFHDFLRINKRWLMRHKATTQVPVERIHQDPYYMQVVAHDEEMSFTVKLTALRDLNSILTAYDTFGPVGAIEHGITCGTTGVSTSKDTAQPLGCLEWMFGKHVLMTCNPGESVHDWAETA